MDTLYCNDTPDGTFVAQIRIGVIRFGSPFLVGSVSNSNATTGRYFSIFICLCCQALLIEGYKPRFLPKSTH